MNFARKYALVIFTVVLLAYSALISNALHHTAAGSTTTAVQTPPAANSGSTKARKTQKVGRKTQPKGPKLPLHARDYVIARGLELWRGNYEFTNIGVNIPDLFVRFLNNRDGDAIAAMKDASKVGARFVRCDGCTRSASEFQRYVTDKGSWLAAFQRMLSAADELGISIVPVLLPDIHTIPAYGVLSPARPQDGSIGAYLSDGTSSNRIAIQYVSSIVTRFKDDPRVLFWEIGDEYNLNADQPAVSGSRTEAECFSSDQVRSFLIELSSTIKAIDKNHLVSSGNADMRPNSWHLRQEMLVHRSDPNKWDYSPDGPTDSFNEYSQMIDFFTPTSIDIVSVHEAPPGLNRVGWLVEDDEHALRLPWSQQAAGSVHADTTGAPSGKPIFIGAFGQPFLSGDKALPIDWTLDFLRRIRNGPTSLCALSIWDTGDSNPTSASVMRSPELASQIAADNLALLTTAFAAPYNK